MPKSTHLSDGTELPLPGFGAMGMSFAYGTPNDEESKATLRKAIEIGCTVWDTATIYGMGHNEKIIGEVLREGDNRKKVFLIDKFGNRLDNENKTYYVDGSPEYTIEALDQSIKDLGGLYPDAYLLHRIDKKTPIEQTVRALDALRKEGKTKYIGLSECSAETLRRAAKEAKIDFVEVEYSPWELVMERNGVIDACKELGIKVLAYSPLGRGLLTGSYEDFNKDGDVRANWPRLNKENFAKNYKIVEEFERLAKKKGCKPSQLALAWLMAQGDHIVPIPGTKSEKYLVENFASRDVDLSAEEIAEIRKIVEENAPIGDRYPAAHMGSLDD
ncbi:hypothetical protein JCM10908_003699 [Rhodotorula pacifica]|uniref:uncharacterized protein n=1 Tax=Rhodotorula pacifica TaxID=1495444 RepID=UPI00316C9C57